MGKTLAWEKILSKAQEIIKNNPPLGPRATISERTIRSQKILETWKQECCHIDPNLVAEIPDPHANPNAKSLQFALHDKQKRIVYELKLNTANPKTFLDKLVRKLITYNTLQEASTDCRELMECIAGEDYHKISKVHVFAYQTVIKVYREDLIKHYLSMIRKKFRVRIYFHLLS